MLAVTRVPERRSTAGDTPPAIQGVATILMLPCWALAVTICWSRVQCALFMFFSCLAFPQIDSVVHQIRRLSLATKLKAAPS